jgi:hypothetical protein
MSPAGAVQTPNLHVFGYIFQLCSIPTILAAIRCASLPRVSSHVLQQRPIGEIPVGEMEVDGT